MARNFVRASLMYYTAPSLWANGAFTGVNNTVLAKFRTNVLTTPTKGMFYLWDDTITDEFYLFLGLENTTGKLQSFTRTNGGQQISALHHTIPNTGQWYSGGFRRTNNTLDTFLDGVIGNTPATNESIGTYTSVNSQVIGSQGVGNYWDGDLADVAVWDVSLTQAEISAYHAGVSPNLIRPDKLVGYYPLWGGTIEAEYTGTGDVLTPVNAPTVSDSTFVASTYKKRVIPTQSTAIRRKEIEHIYKDNLTAESQASSTWRTILTISKSSLPARSRWWIYCKGVVSTNNTSNSTFVQLLLGGVELQGSLVVMKMKTADYSAGRDYCYSKVIEIGETPGDIELQIRNTSNTVTRMTHSQIFMMRLDKDFKEYEDYWYQENRVTTTCTTSFGNDTAQVVEIKHPISELGTGNEYMGFCCMNHDSGNTVDDTRKLAITFNVGGDNTSRAEINRATTDERVITQSMKGVAQDAFTTTFGLARTAVNNSGSENRHTYSSVLILKKDLFDQAILRVNTATRIPTVAGTPEIEHTLDFTPNKAGSFMCIGDCRVKPGAGSTAGFRNGRINFADETGQLPATTTYYGTDMETVNEDNSINAMAYLPNLPTSLKTLDLEVTSNEANDMEFNDIVGFVFSMLPAKHFKVSGVITELTIPVSRTVRAFLSSTGELLGETTSRASDGFYLIDGLPGGNISVIAYDDAAGSSYNAQIFDKVVPVNS